MEALQGTLPDAPFLPGQWSSLCLLYTSDAADDLLCVGLGGRRLFKKKKNTYTRSGLFWTFDATVFPLTAHTSIAHGFYLST